MKNVFHNNLKKSLRDKSAAINLARLFADRCLQYGITHVDYFKDIGFENSEKVIYFILWLEK